MDENNNNQARNRMKVSYGKKDKVKGICDIDLGKESIKDKLSEHNNKS